MTSSALVWDVAPVALTIGPVELRWYGLFLGLGLLLGFLHTDWLFRREGKAKSFLPYVPYGFIGPIVGGRLAHFIFYEPRALLGDPLRLLDFVGHSGLASHGAVLGLIVAFWLFSKRHAEVSLAWLVDRGSLTLPLIGACIRVGNFFRSEVIGTPSDLPWSVVFAAVDQQPRHPAQLYEASAYLAVFAVLMAAYLRTGWRRAEWQITGCAMLAVFTFRFFIEFLKADQSDLVSGWELNMGQILSLPLIAVACAIIVGAKWGKQRIKTRK